jgi:hypothetical protein
MPFDQWMKSVDALLVERVGLDSGSIEDSLWFDDYDDGLSPQEEFDQWFERVQPIL